MRAFAGCMIWAFQQWSLYHVCVCVCQRNCALTVNHHKWIHFRKCSHVSMSIVHPHCYNKVGKWCTVCLPPYILWSRLTTKEVAYRLVSHPDLLCHHSAPLLFWQETSYDNTSKTQRMSVNLLGRSHLLQSITTDHPGIRDYITFAEIKSHVILCQMFLFLTKCLPLLLRHL